MRDELQKELWNKRAKTYYPKDTPYQRKLKEIKKDILEYYCTKKICLDIGCGTGEITALASNYAKSVIGIDLSKNMLAKARNQFTKIHNITFVEGNALNLPFSNKKFDVVFSFATFYFIRDIDAAFLEVSRVLKDGGIFILDFANKYSITAVFTSPQYPPNSLFYLSVPEVINKLKEHFIIIEHRKLEFIPAFNNTPPLPKYFWSKVLSEKLGNKILDERISSLFPLSFFSGRQIIICKNK